MTYIQKLDMISSLHTTYGVLTLAIRRGKHHFVMAIFPSEAPHQRTKLFHTSCQILGKHKDDKQIRSEKTTILLN